MELLFCFILIKKANACIKLYALFISKKKTEVNVIFNYNQKIHCLFNVYIYFVNNIEGEHVRLIYED